MAEMTSDLSRVDVKRVAASESEAKAVGASASETLAASFLAATITMLEELDGCAECVAKIETERRAVGLPLL